MHRQINKMAWGYTSNWDFCGRLCVLHVPWMDLKVWSTCSDRGAQFTSSLWSAICCLLKIKHKTTTAFHPQSNGMVERFHRQLKNSLRARLASSNWFEHLPWVLLGLCTSPREDSATFASEAVYGSELTQPGKFLEVQDLQQICSMKTLKFNVWFSIILLKLTLFQKLFLQNSHLVQWFLYARMDMLLL